MDIYLKNTATGKKERFEPIEANNVRMYLCGPTVYDRAHLGNARPVVVIDVLYRLLRHVYGETSVTYVRNFTDVDDKINATALARKEAGAPGTLEDLVAERSDETISWYLADMDALGALRPNAAPRATEYIAQMVAMIEGLIASGHAYTAEGHVLFSVEADRDYGGLSRRSVDDMIAGARVEVAPYKKSPMDFVLWKPSDAALPGWDSPWGRGRPGWHIECSAMAHDLLGKTFDIHAGGNDLIFPHHENEIAQSRCSGHGFAKVWLHNEMLQVEGKKMSKSLGNFFTVRDLLDQGVPGEVIRFVFLGTHYRKPMDWTDKKRAEAEATLVKWFDWLKCEFPDFSKENLVLYSDTKLYPPDDAVLAALRDDLNTPKVIARLHELYGRSDFESVRGFLGSLSLLGILNSATQVDTISTTGIGWSGDLDPALVQQINEILRARQDAKKARDFQKSDAIRDALAAAGINVVDTADGPDWSPGPSLDPAKINGILSNIDR
ncbi:MAG: cysteine--tRNA ligase [Pseudomonadota bacterium]